MPPKKKGDDDKKKPRSVQSSDKAKAKRKAKPKAKPKATTIFEDEETDTESDEQVVEPAVEERFEHLKDLEKDDEGVEETKEEPEILQEEKQEEDNIKKVETRLESVRRRIRHLAGVLAPGPRDRELLEGLRDLEADLEQNAFVRNQNLERARAAKRPSEGELEGELDAEKIQKVGPSSFRDPLASGVKRPGPEFEGGEKIQKVGPSSFRDPLAKGVKRPGPELQGVGKKSVVEEVPQDIPLPPKRGRGRPRKKPPVVPDAVPDVVPPSPDADPAKKFRPSPPADQEPDAMEVEDPEGQPVHVGGGGGDEPEDGGDDQGPPPPPGEVALGVEGEGGETGGDGADGRDDLLSPDEAKTLLRDEFQWKVEDTRYLTKASRGKIGYGQGSEANVQPIQPFGTTLKESPDESRGESVFKQKDSRFEPFRGQHEIVAGEKDSKKDAGGAGEEILATAMTPFAKIGAQVIWIPFYAKAVKMYFTAQDFEELVSNVTEQRGKLKLKAPNPSVIQNMQKTVDQVRTSLRAFEVFPLKVRHENLTTRYAEWLELRQIMKAVSKYQKTTTGMYNQAGLFSGSLREAVSKAIDDAVGMVGKKQKKTLGRGLEGAGATQRGEGAHNSPAEFQAFNPFQVKESPIKKTRSTLPRFF